eukprot:2029898-Amphidinium_carterae.1
MSGEGVCCWLLSHLSEVRAATGLGSASGGRDCYPHRHGTAPHPHLGQNIDRKQALLMICYVL